MHVKFPKAIITSRAGASVPRATRCTGRVAPGHPSPAAPSRARQPGPPWGPRGARRRVGYAPPASWVGPVVSVPASPSHRRRSRPPRRVARLRRRRLSHGGPRHRGGPRCTTSPSAEMKTSPATPPAGLVGDPSPAPAGRPSTAATAPGAATAPAAPAMPDRTGAVRPAQCVRRCRRACGSRTTPTAESGGRRHARQASLRGPEAGPKQRRPRRPALPRTPPRPPVGRPRARRRSFYRNWGRRPLRFRRCRCHPPSGRGSLPWGRLSPRRTGRSSATSLGPPIPRTLMRHKPCALEAGSRRIRPAGDTPPTDWGRLGASTGPAPLAPRVPPPPLPGGAPGAAPAEDTPAPWGHPPHRPVPPRPPSPPPVEFLAGWAAAARAPPPCGARPRPSRPIASPPSTRGRPTPTPPSTLTGGGAAAVASLDYPPPRTPGSGARR